MSKNYHLPMMISSSRAMPSQAPGTYELLPEEPIHLQDYLHILKKRKRLVIGIFLGTILLTVAVVLLVTPIYLATALLQITPDNNVAQFGEHDPLAALKVGQDLSRFQETQVKILTSRSLAWRLIESLNLENHPEFKVQSEAEPPLSPQQVKNDLLNLFQQKLDIRPIKDSYLVEASFKSSDQSLAQRVINALAREYVQLAIDKRTESFSLVKEWLEKQLHSLAARVQDSQQKLYEFGQKSDFFALEDKDNVIIQKYLELNGLLTKAQSERMAKEAQYRQIEEKGPEVPLITNNPLILALRQELVSQTAKTASLKRIYLPGHPEMQAETAKLHELQGRLNNEVKRIQEAVKADYEAAKRTEALLSEAFKEQKDRMANLQKDLVEYKILKRDAQTTEQLYQALLARMKETTVASTMVASNVAVIDPADVPVEPYFPRKGLFLGLSGIIGLCLGLGAAFLAEYLDDSLKTTEEVERVCRLPSLGLVPQLSEETGARNGRSHLYAHKLQTYLPFGRNQSQVAEGNGDGVDLAVLNEPTSIISEAIRQVRTSIMLSAVNGPPQSIIVTSPNPQEGKSTIASNLAVSLALDGRKVVLLDCDLRKPRLHRVFEMPPQPGMSTFLTGNNEWEEIIRPTKAPNLWFVPAGPVPPNPFELLNSEAFKALMDELRREFQHVIVDTPPALGFADARVISKLMDGVLLIMKQNSTPREAGRLTCQLFSQIQAPLLGIILNQVNGHFSSRYELYYHPKYYRDYYRGGQRHAAEG
ncbi:MAG: polysaccharide biosynthesis tyrosine autokinase [Deltaproteobacteria bacterium]|nr:polysaccharide biosynthesis tyrosine autokinase [Deltaproteobacteria bacterium]